MILDTIQNLTLYSALNPHIAQVAEFIATHHLEDIPQGRVEIDGNRCFANFDIAHGRTKEEAVVETHNRMVDIQLILNNEELVGWTPRNALPEAPYNEEKDFTLYPPQPCEQYLTLRPGQFMLFLPEDGHAPCISTEKEYRKVIFKMEHHA